MEKVRIKRVVALIMAVVVLVEVVAVVLVVVVEVATVAVAAVIVVAATEILKRRKTSGLYQSHTINLLKCKSHLYVFGQCSMVAELANGPTCTRRGRGRVFVLSRPPICCHYSCASDSLLTLISSARVREGVAVTCRFFLLRLVKFFDHN